MINALTTKVLHHRAVVMVLMCVFIFCGAMAFHEMPVEAYPDVTNVTVQVLTLFPGHAAEEVERMVTIPIENVMNGIPKRVSMRSISEFGLSQITLVFEDDADNAYVRNLANQLLGTVTLPAGAQAALSPGCHADWRSLSLHDAGGAGFSAGRSARAGRLGGGEENALGAGRGGCQSLRRADQAIPSADRSRPNSSPTA